MIAKSKWDDLLKLGEPAVQPLIQALSYTFRFFDQRESVAEVLGKIRDPAAVEPLIRALADQTNKILRFKAAEALGKIGDDRALDPLIYALHDNEAIVRVGAAESLGKLDLPKAIEPLKEALKDLDSLVRWQVANSLDKLRWTASNKEEQAYYLIASRRIFQVEQIGTPAIQPLIHTLRSFDETTAEAAISALANIGKAIGDPAISLLIAALKDEPLHVRSKISLALAKIEEKAARLLSEAAKNDNENVRKGAKDALARIDFSEQGSVLKDPGIKEPATADKEEQRNASIFICYAQPDLEKARQLYDCLEDIPQFEPWINEKKLPIGAKWKGEIEEAIDESDFFVVCVSSSSVNRIGEVQREINRARERSLKMPDDWIYIMPVRLDTCSVPKNLSDYHYADLPNPADCKTLVHSIQTELKRRQERQDIVHSNSQQNS